MNLQKKGPCFNPVVARENDGTIVIFTGGGGGGDGYDGD